MLWSMLAIRRSLSVMHVTCKHMVVKICDHMIHSPPSPASLPSVHTQYSIHEKQAPAHINASLPQTKPCAPRASAHTMT